MNQNKVKSLSKKLTLRVILIALAILFIYLMSSMFKGKIKASMDMKTLETYLKRNPAAWSFWSALTLWITRIEAATVPDTGHDAQWELYKKRHDNILGLLRRVQGYIETHPDDVLRIQDMEHVLPVAHDFFTGYRSCLMFAADTHGGKEYLSFVQQGLDNIDKILNEYMHLLFQNKSIDIRAEIDVMLQWYGENKGEHVGYPRAN
jgi:hypothetical protein